MSYISKLQDAIRYLYQCDSKHIGTTTVVERFRAFGSETLWEGEVEVFEISGHAKTRRAYAWKHRVGGEQQQSRYVAVLAIDPITSAESAVKAALAAEFATRLW
jgi:hypothetical protein